MDSNIVQVSQASEIKFSVFSKLNSCSNTLKKIPLMMNLTMKLLMEQFLFVHKLFICLNDHILMMFNVPCRCNFYKIIFIITNISQNLFVYLLYFSSQMLCLIWMLNKRPKKRQQTVKIRKLHKFNHKVQWILNYKRSWIDLRKFKRIRSCYCKL